MARIDLRKLALRLKILEMLKIYTRRRQLEGAPEHWRRTVRPN